MADLSNVTPSTKNARSFVSALALALSALGAVGCGGLEAGIDYPETPSIDRFIRTPENQTGPAIALRQR